jgi:hypothetical protein
LKRKLLTCALLLSLAGCQKQTQTPQAVEAQHALKTTADTNTYTLQISFFGLIAFAQQPNKVWALLVNADYASDPTEDQLPPGVFAELAANPATRADLLQHQFPPHRARIRFRNAHIVAGDVPDPTKGRSITGSDITFSNNVQGLSIDDLSSLSHSSKIAASRALSSTAAAAAAISTLDQLDPDVLAPTLDKKRLSARAQITAGKVQALPVTDCGKRTFSYKTAANGLLECPGKPEDAVQLAEQVVVTQEKVSGQTVISLGGDSITIEPQDPQQPVIVEVVNQIDEALDDPTAPLCDMPHQHLAAFRWFYRLLRPANQKATTNHFFPCVMAAPAGGAKCPQDLFGNGG